MYNHAPKKYQCPFCLLIRGIENIYVHSKQSDIFYQDRHVVGLISSDWWPNNPGSVLVIPVKHYENIYDLPAILSGRIHRLEQQVALAIKKLYKSDGVSSRQHNEPAGGQDIWHFHVQVLPRYDNDRLYQLVNQRKLAALSRRRPYAKKLRNYFKNL